MKSHRNDDAMSVKTSKVPANDVLVINKGQIFNELERLKGLDNHRMKLDNILSRDTRAKVRQTIDRADPRYHEENRIRTNEYNNKRRHEELTKENAKILQKIVEARQINVKARH